MLISSAYHNKPLSKVRLIKSFFSRYASRSYYDILNVPQSSSSKDIRDAFITLSKKNHPDKHLNDPSMHERFVQINEAYSVLINPSKRRAYDITLTNRLKLEPVHVHTSRYTYTYPTGVKKTKHSEKKTDTKTHQQSSFKHDQSTSGSGSSQNYSWSWEEKGQTKESDSYMSYYGIRGLKKVSNKRVVMFILLFTTLTIGIQFLAIINYSARIRQKMEEQSRKNSLLLSLIHEKARLYGSDYKINVLKNTLKNSFDSSDTELEPTRVIDVSNSSNVIGDSDNQCIKCKKCKKKVITAADSIN